MPPVIIETVDVSTHVGMQTLQILAGFFWPIWVCAIIYAIIIAKRYPVSACVLLTAGAILLPNALLLR